MSEKRSRSKGCLTALILVIVLIAGIGTGIYIALPKMIAKAVKSGSVPDFIPEELTETIQALSANINNMEPYLEELGMDRQKLADYINEIKPGDMRDFMKEFQDTQLTSPAELLTIAEKHIGLPEMDKEKVEYLLENEVSMKDIKSAQNQLENNGLKSVTSGLGFSALKSMVTEIISEE